MAENPPKRWGRRFHRSAPLWAALPRSRSPSPNRKPKYPTGRRCNRGTASPAPGRSGGGHPSPILSSGSSRHRRRVYRGSQTRLGNIDAQTTGRTNRYSEYHQIRISCASMRSRLVRARDEEAIPGRGDRSSSFRCSSPSDREENRIRGSSHAAGARCLRTTSSNRLG